MKYVWLFTTDSSSHTHDPIVTSNTEAFSVNITDENDDSWRQRDYRR
jgi:hypothetical protein